VAAKRRFAAPRGVGAPHGLAMALARRVDGRDDVSTEGAFQTRARILGMIAAELEPHAAVADRAVRIEIDARSRIADRCRSAHRARITYTRPSNKAMHVLVTAMGFPQPPQLRHLIAASLT
jgi:hypothetical protein